MSKEESQVNSKSTQENYAKMIYSLWRAGNQSFERADAIQARLSKATDEFMYTAQRLPSEMARSLEARLPIAAEHAARMIASKWTEANVHAERAAAAYETATQQARRTVYGVAATLLVLFAAVLLILALWILPQFEQVAAMRSEKAYLEATINLLTRNGGRANITRCLDNSQRLRLCVKVDETAKTADKGLKVIRGY